MARYDSTTAELLIFTFKEGALAAVAHDLKLRAEKFTLELDDSSCRLLVEADSLRVVTPMKDGQDNPSAMPRALYGEIEKNTRGEVLDAKRFQTIEFRSTSLGADAVVGLLTLHGVTRELRGRRAGNVAEFELDQRDFGVKPYSAMLGTLKVKPVVKVRLALRAV